MDFRNFVCYKISENNFVNTYEYNYVSAMYIGLRGRILN